MAIACFPAVPSDAPVPLVAADDAAPSVAAAKAGVAEEEEEEEEEEERFVSEPFMRAARDSVDFVQARHTIRCEAAMNGMELLSVPNTSTRA